MLSIRNGDVADVWQTSDGQHLAVFESNASISSFAINSDGKYAAIGTTDGALTIWDITGGSTISTKMQGGSISYLDYSPSGIYILSGNINGSGLVLDAQNGQEVTSLFHGAPIASGDFSADENNYSLLERMASSQFGMLPPFLKFHRPYMNIQLPPWTSVPIVNILPQVELTFVSMFGKQMMQSNLLC